MGTRSAFDCVRYNCVRHIRVYVGNLGCVLMLIHIKICWVYCMQIAPDTVHRLFPSVGACRSSVDNSCRVIPVTSADPRPDKLPRPSPAADQPGSSAPPRRQGDAATRRAGTRPIEKRLGPRRHPAVPVRAQVQARARRRDSTTASDTPPTAADARRQVSRRTPHTQHSAHTVATALHYTTLHW